jgi:hypothetical protein
VAAFHACPERELGETGGSCTYTWSETEMGARGGREVEREREREREREGVVIGNRSGTEELHISDLHLGLGRGSSMCLLALVAAGLPPLAFSR